MVQRLLYGLFLAVLLKLMMQVKYLEINVKHHTWKGRRRILRSSLIKFSQLCKVQKKKMGMGSETRPSPEPAFVLAHDRQLDDLEKYRFRTSFPIWLSMKLVGSRWAKRNVNLIWVTSTSVPCSSKSCDQWSPAPLTMEVENASSLTSVPVSILTGIWKKAVRNSFCHQLERLHGNSSQARKPQWYKTSFGCSRNCCRSV